MIGEESGMEPARPDRKWRIGRQQLIGLSLLIIPLVAMLVAVVWPLLFPKPMRWPEVMICDQQLKQIGMALRMYAEDNDDTLPPAGSWQEAVAEYVRDGEVFTCPTTGKRYVFDDNPSGKILLKIANQDRVPVAWDAATDEGRGPHQRYAGEWGFNVVFLDAHSKWLDEATFSELMTTRR